MEVLQLRAARTLRVGARARRGATRRSSLHARPGLGSDPSGPAPYAGRVSEQLDRSCPAAGVPAHARLGVARTALPRPPPVRRLRRDVHDRGSPAHRAALPRLPRRTAPHARPVTAVTSPPRPPLACQRTRGAADSDRMELVRNPSQGSFRISEVLAALSHALDLTEGQPVGHAARSCVLGVQDRRPDRARRGRSQRALLRAAPEGRRLLVERGSHVDALRRRRSRAEGRRQARRLVASRRGAALRQQARRRGRLAAAARRTRRQRRHRG